MKKKKSIHPNRKVLILPNFGLGDTIQITSVFKMVHLANQKIDLYCGVYSKAHRDIVEFNPYIAGVVPFRDPYNIGPRWVDRVLALKTNSQACKSFDDVLSAVPADIFGEYLKLPISNTKARFQCIDSIPVTESMEFQVWNYQRKIAEFLNIAEYDFHSPELFLSTEESEKGKRLLKKASVDGSLVAVLAYDAGTLEKALPVEQTIKVADFLVELGCCVVLLRGKNFPENADLVASKTQVHIPRLDEFRDLIALISNCQIVICPDTGIGHLSAALGIPTFSIFGPTNLIFRPVGGPVCIIDKSPGCRYRDSSQECVKCVHHEYVDDGKHHAACMYWVNRNDLTRAFYKTEMSNSFPNPIPPVG